MARFPLILCLAALAAIPARASADDLFAGTAGCAPGGVCQLGGSIRQGAFSRAPWVPYLSDDPFVRAADACLGYVATRDERAWQGGRAETVGQDRMRVVLGDGATRITFQDIRDDHFSGYGQLVCQYEGPSGRRMDLAEFWPWAELRLTARDGWRVADELRGKLEFLRFNNAWIHASLRAYPTADSAEVIRLQLDYSGPPVTFD